MKTKFLCTAFIVATAAFAAMAQERYVRPVDQAALDSTFLAFRTKLIAAAERRDVKFILGTLDPQIKASFGGHTGVGDFKEYWKIDRKDTKFWDEFLPVITNGGSFSASTEASRKMFVAPYTFSEWPDDLDAFEHAAIFGENVNLRESASTDATVVAKLSYNIVKIVDSKPKPATETNGWLLLETLGGKKGWVKAEYVRSPIDHRAGFEKKRGVWKMTYFVAGD